jgi:TrmH family RNA methyltransferase
LARVRIVLVQPETPANIGAVARVVRNTGLAGLSLVRPGDWKTVECWRTAWGAHEVLEQAAVFTDLGSALAGSGYVAGLSGKSLRGAPALDVREMAVEVGALDVDEPVALVFGPETSGLGQPELSLCGRIARIPAHPDQPSLNLSHAVMVAAYEVFRAAHKTPPEPRQATHGDKERMLGLLLEGLRSIEALPDRQSESYFLEWRALFQRSALTPKEVRLLEHMARKMTMRRRGHPPAGS